MRTARDLMTSPAHCLAPGDSLADAARRLAQHDVGSMPVVEGDKILGIVTDRDLVVSGLAKGLDATTPVSDIMSTDVVCVQVGDSATHAADVMGDRQVRRVPVLDGDRLVGMVSQADVALELSTEIACEVIREISEPAAS